MKFKHLGRQIVALLLSLCLSLSILPTSALAATGNGIGEAGSIGVAGTWDITYTSSRPDGVRVTLMDKSTGKRVPGVMSIDYARDASIADNVVEHAYKLCKTDYKDGMSITRYDGITIEKKYDAKTIDGLPQIIDNPINLVENKIDEIHTVVVKFNFNEPKEPTPADPTPDRIKTYDVAQFIDDTTATAGSSRHLDTLVGYVDNETSYNNTAMSAASHISNKAEAAVIKSKVGTAPKIKDK